MTDAFPLSARWLSAASVAALLDCEPRQVRERFALRPDFPRSVRPGGTGHPRWNAAEVDAWMRRQRVAGAVVEPVRRPIQPTNGS